MKKLIYCLLILFVGLTACTEDVNVVVDEALINYKTSGELSVTVLGDNDAPLAGVKLYLYQGTVELHEAITDDKGMASFGKLNMGTYTVYGNDLVVNGVRYNINKWVQVLSSEVNEIVIRPIGFSGKVTLNIYEVIPVTATSFTEAKPLANGKVALIPNDYRSGTFSQLLAQKVVEGTLDGSSNQIVFEKVPQGDYIVMVYIDQNHYSLRLAPEYGYYDPIYFKVERNDDLTINAIVKGHELFDYTGTAVVSAKEILPLNYYSSDYDVIRSITFGNLALLPMLSGYSSTEYKFDQLLEMAVAIKPMPATGEPVEFTNVPIGSYNVMAYGDNGFCILNNSSSMYGYLNFFVGANRASTVTGFAYGYMLKEYFYDVTCTVSNSSSTDKANVYVLLSTDYISLTTTERATESAVSALALATATTDNAGKVVLRSIAYKSVYFVIFSQSGKKAVSQRTIYDNTSFSIYMY